MSRLSRWCFTDFDRVKWGEIWKRNKDKIRYIGIGVETCPKTKKTHIQGWIQLINKISLSGLKTLMGSKKIHLEPCRGSVEANEKYCRKDGKFECFGKFVTQGERVDLNALKDIIDNGGDMMDIANADFGTYLRYSRGFEKYKQMVDQKKRRSFRKVKVCVLSGPTGCGKTRRAVEACPDYFKISGGEMQWFDGYNGEKTLVIDEYDNQVNCTRLLSLLDGYQYRLPIKGGFTYANWDRVIITTNNKELHTGAKQEHQSALKRRINKFISFFKPAQLSPEVGGNTAPPQNIY